MKELTLKELAQSFTDRLKELVDKVKKIIPEVVGQYDIQESDAEKIKLEQLSEKYRISCDHLLENYTLNINIAGEEESKRIADIQSSLNQLITNYAALSLTESTPELNISFDKDHQALEKELEDETYLNTAINNLTKKYEADLIALEVNFENQKKKLEEKVSIRQFLTAVPQEVVQIENQSGDLLTSIDSDSKINKDYNRNIAALAMNSYRKFPLKGQIDPFQFSLIVERLDLEFLNKFENDSQLDNMELVRHHLELFNDVRLSKLDSNLFNDRNLIEIFVKNKKDIMSLEQDKEDKKKVINDKLKEDFEICTSKLDQIYNKLQNISEQIHNKFDNLAKLRNEQTSAENFTPTTDNAFPTENEYYNEPPLDPQNFIEHQESQNLIEKDSDQVLSNYEEFLIQIDAKKRISMPLVIDTVKEIYIWKDEQKLMIAAEKLLDSCEASHLRLKIFWEKFVELIKINPLEWDDLKCVKILENNLMSSFNQLKSASNLGTNGISYYQNKRKILLSIIEKFDAQISIEIEKKYPNKFENFETFKTLLNDSNLKGKSLKVSNCWKNNSADFSREIIDFDKEVLKELVIKLVNSGDNNQKLLIAFFIGISKARKLKINTLVNEVNKEQFEKDYYDCLKEVIEEVTCPKNLKLKSYKEKIEILKTASNNLMDFESVYTEVESIKPSEEAKSPVKEKDYAERGSLSTNQNNYGKFFSIGPSPIPSKRVGEAIPNLGINGGINLEITEKKIFLQPSINQVPKPSEEVKSFVKLS